MSKRNFSSEEEEQAQSWRLPIVEQLQTKEESQKTNFINRRSDWKYEPPEEEIEILPPTAEEIEAIRQAAYEEGFEQGKQEGFVKGEEEGKALGYEEGFSKGTEEGKAVGLEEGQTSINEQVDIWQSLSEDLHEPLQKVDDEVKQQLVKLSVALAKAVIRCETSLSDSTILQALTEGMKALPINEKEHQIHLHPDDLSLVVEHYGEQSIEQKGWKLIEAPELTRGGCEIVTTNNAVDVSIERRSHQVLDKFLNDQGLSDE